MSDDDKKMAVASFKFGVISDFINRQNFSYGEKAKLFREKTSLSYVIPFSSKTTVSKPAIIKWIRDYKKGGQRLEALYPKIRKDRGDFRSLDGTLKLAIIDILKKNPNVKTRAIIRELVRQKIIENSAGLNFSTVYRFVKKEKQDPLRQDCYDDRRRFEAQYPNQMWQSDVMHGPHIRSGEGAGKKKKTYLIAFIDDHSRLIIHAEFFFSEDVINFKSALHTALLRRGLPQTLYVDNGACFKSKNLEYIGAALGISIKHSRPYIPQGRGKIERWFKNIRESFLAFFNSHIFLDQLNESLDNWVDIYNSTIHSSTNETPLRRFVSGVECTRPAPHDLENYFRIIEQRKVKKDRTFRLNKIIYEAPACLIDKRVDLKFYPEDERRPVEIFFQGMSFGFATVLDVTINGVVGRDWMQVKDNKHAPAISGDKSSPKITSGELSFKEDHDAF